MGSERDDTELELSARLLRSLAHRLRGDLSVVTNDLVYLGSVVGPQEVERSRARCAGMAHVLACLSSLPSSSHRERYFVRDIAPMWGVSLANDCDGTVPVVIDPHVVRYIAKLLTELLGEWSGNISVQHTNAPHARCRMRFHEARSLSKHYFSAAHMTAEEFGERSVIEGCLIDILLRDHGWTASFGHDNETVVIDIDIPVVVESASNG